MAGVDRRALRRAILTAAPWIADDERGPQAVAAGRCDRCGEHPRLLPTCGASGFEALCRDCGLELGDEAWCEGHRDDGDRARSWAMALPEDWAAAVVLFWVATGELRLDDQVLPPMSDPGVQAALGATPTSPEG